VNIKGSRKTASGEYFKILHWMLRITTHWHPITREIKKAISTCYGLDPHTYNLPEKDSVESLGVSKRYELIRLLRHLLIDHPSKYLQSSSANDLMCRIWFGKWLGTSFWYSSMTCVGRNRNNIADRQFNIEQPNTLLGCSIERNKKRTGMVERNPTIYSHELKSAASQLSSDGISTLHIAGILNVPRIEAWEWIKEQCGSVPPGRQAQGRGWGRR
jgi:hypothetical protein